MALRSLLVLAVLGSLVVGCTRDANGDERAVCQAVRRLESVKERDEERQLLDKMVEKSRASGNAKLKAGSVGFKKAVDDKDLSAATASLTQLTDECERLGLRRPPS